MNLIVTILATLGAGIGSVWVAALFMRFGVDRRMDGLGAQHLLSLAAGALLATAFMHLLPEAFESQAGARELFATLVVGLVFFFLLDKAELWHHGHEHHAGHGHGHGHGHPAPPPLDAPATAAFAAAATAVPDHAAAAHPQHHALDHGHSPGAEAVPAQRHHGGWTILAGDSVHCFGDGILIASAMAADLRLGLVTALAVLVHEVPHHMGDLVVLRQGGDGRRNALVKVSLAGSVTVLGGLAGYFLLEALRDWLPYFLVVASSSFVYVALADLIPQLQRRLSVAQTVAQVAWLLAGMAVVTLVSGLAHGH